MPLLDDILRADAEEEDRRRREAETAMAPKLLSSRQRGMLTPLDLGSIAPRTYSPEGSNWGMSPQQIAAAALPLPTAPGARRASPEELAAAMANKRVIGDASVPRTYSPEGADWGMSPQQIAASSYTADLPFLTNLEGGSPGGMMYNGMAPVPRQWTAEDLEPTSVLGYTGSLRKAFSGGDTRGYTMASPNLPLFRADMAQRSQAMNFIAEMAANANRQQFAAAEGERNRSAEMERLRMTLGSRDENNRMRQLADIAAMPLGPTRSALVNRIEGLSPEQKAENALGPILQKIMAPEHLGAIVPLVDEQTDYGGLGQALAKRNLTGEVLSKRLSDIQARPHGFLPRWGLGRSLSPQEQNEMSLLERLVQAQQPRR